MGVKVFCVEFTSLNLSLKREYNITKIDHIRSDKVQDVLRCVDSFLFVLYLGLCYVKEKFNSFQASLQKVITNKLVCVL